MSRTDEILEGWRVAAQAGSAPRVAPRPVTTRSLLPVGTLAAAAAVALLMVGLAAGRLTSTPAGTSAPSGATSTVNVPLDPTHTLAVAIRDTSGSLRSVRAATAAELAAAPGVCPTCSLPDTVAAFNASGSASTELTLVWAGGICDKTADVDIAPDVRAITVTPGAAEPCDAVSVGRGLVLTFAAPVDARTVSVTKAAAPSPSPIALLTFTVASPAPGTALACPAYLTVAHVEGSLAGSPTDPEHVWLVGPSGRISVVWPAGFTVAFEPDAVLYAADGSVFARSGEAIILGQIPAASHAGTAADPYLAAGLIEARQSNGDTRTECAPAADGTPYGSPPTASSSPEPSPSGSPSAADVDAASAAVTTYTNDLVAGHYAAAWAMLGPEYQALRTLAEYTFERSTFFKSVEGRFLVTARPTDVGPVTDWLAGTNGASIDLRHAVLVEVSYPALAGNNAGFELIIANPTAQGERLYPVR